MCIRDRRCTAKRTLAKSVYNITNLVMFDNMGGKICQCNPIPHQGTVSPVPFTASLTSLTFQTCCRHLIKMHWVRLLPFVHIASFLYQTTVTRQRWYRRGSRRGGSGGTPAKLWHVAVQYGPSVPQISEITRDKTLGVSNNNVSCYSTNIITIKQRPLVDKSRSWL